MSYCVEEGKDRIIFITKEDEEKNQEELEENRPRGLINPDGSLNWDCPCLGNYPVGPCGESFKEFFTCLHYSEEEPKGSECMEKGDTWFDCMKNNKEFYKVDDDDEEKSDDVLGDLQDMDEKESAKS